MILQLGALLSGLTNIGGSYLGTTAAGVIANTLAPALNIAGNLAQNIGTQILGNEIGKLVAKNTSNDVQQAIKKALQTQSNAVSPVAAPGNTAVGSGGPATGTAYTPPVVIPTSISSPIVAAANVNPNFIPVQVPAGQGFLGNARVQNVGFMSSAANLARRALGSVAENFSPFTPTGRRMIGTAAGAIGLEAGAQMAADAILNPNTAYAPGGSMATAVQGPINYIPTGMPGGCRVWAREANGCNTQWFFFDGTNMLPIDRSQAGNFKKESIYRLRVDNGKYIKLGRRRMNPMNISAFFRAGRRVDAAERIARKLFSEKRRQKTGSIRRKSRSKRKR